MKPKRKSPLAQLISSHKRLLKAFRHQTEEIGHLRRLVLEISCTVGQKVWDRNASILDTFPSKGLVAAAKKASAFRSNPILASLTASIDSPQP